MKTFVSLLLLVILAGGYIYYRLSSTPQPVSTSVAPVTVTEQLPNSLPTPGTPVQIAQFTNDQFQFSFTFRIKPYGYSLRENTPVQNQEQGTLFGVTLLRSADFNAVESATAQGIPHDGPPSMSVFVLDAKGVSDAGVWLTEHRQLTNCEVGTVLATVVAGKDASSCLWDGLYAGVTVALHYADKMYVLIGVRDEGETTDGYSYKKDFDDLVTSFAVPTGN